MKKIIFLLILATFQHSNVFGMFGANHGKEPAEFTNNVAHKNVYLDTYLDFLNYGIQEKTEILQYILMNPDGIYLEIGTGGDPVGEMFSKLPNNISTTIIASDIDQKVLDALLKRHPKLQKYLNATTGPRLELKQLNAIDMSCFQSNYLSGINASAVLHEIISYAGGISGLEKFFKESHRTLKPNGVLIFRDPEGVLEKDKIVSITLKTYPLRLFVHLFLPKFLDMKYSRLALSRTKSEKYDPKKINLTFYNKNKSTQLSCSYEEYCKLSPYNIDFSKPFIITMPRGLCREIERHYLTYIHECNPLLFLDFVSTNNKQSYSLNYLAKNTNTALNEFLQKHKLQKTDANTISTEVKNLIDNNIVNVMQPLEHGMAIHLENSCKLEKIINLIKKNEFNPDICLTQINSKDYLLDYRVFSVLYDFIEEFVFDDKNGPLNNNDVIHAKWLKREGEESYFYFSDDELIAKVAEITLNSNKNNEKFVLCPISADHNRFVPRTHYNKLLETSMNVNNLNGQSIEIKEGKRIIHFKKMPITQALQIYKDIVKTYPERYKNLQHFIQTIESK